MYIAPTKLRRWYDPNAHLQTFQGHGIYTTIISDKLTSVQLSDRYNYRRPLKEVLSVPLASLRLHARLFANTIEAITEDAEAGVSTIAVASPSAFRIGTYVSVGSNEARVTGNTTELALDRPLLFAAKSGEQVRAHPQDDLLIELRESAIEQADAYMNRSWAKPVFEMYYDEFRIATSGPYFYITEGNETVTVTDFADVPNLTPDSAVRTWVSQKVVRDFENPILGLSKESLKERGTRDYSGDMYEGISHLRMYQL